MAHDIDPVPEELPDPEISEAAARSAVVATGTATYLVTAYRWGWTNGHAYHVYCGPDRTKAIALARAENADRGGKYGCVVWEFDADGIDYKHIAYFPSTPEEESATLPHHNHKIDYYERLGQFVDECMGGKALLPDPANEKYLTYQDVTPLPDYLRAQVEHQRALLRAMTDIAEKRAEKSS